MEPVSVLRPRNGEVAGWLHINGGFAKGDFPIPAELARGAEGTPFDRVTRVLNMAGGVTCTIADEKRERAPAFVFRSARDARQFRSWIGAHLAAIRSAAESTSPDVKLQSIESDVIANVALIQFEFAPSSDRSPEDLVAAIYAACEGIERANPTVLRYFLMSRGGRRVVAEAKIAGALLRQRLGIELGTRRDHAVIETIGRGMTAVIYSDVTPHDELHVSIMIPAVVLDAGGDHLEALGCAGPGNANKLAEIIAATALATWLSRDCVAHTRARAG